MYLITSAFGGTLGLIFLILWGLLSLYSLITVLRTHVNGDTKLLWIVIIIVVPILGSLAYLFWRRVKTL